MNILQGGVDFRGSRLNRIKNLLKFHSPDFLALQEAVGFDNDEDNLLKEFSEHLNLPYYSISRAPRYSDGLCYHVVSLSRFPIQNSKVFEHGNFQSAALSTVIDTPSGTMQISNIHLHDENEDKRLNEIKQILDAVADARYRLILGDFNAISRSDRYDEPKLQCQARFDVIERVSRDMIDVFAFESSKGDFTHPSLISLDQRFTQPRRIDYCFTDSELALKVKHCKVIRNSQTEQTSDHFPLLIDLDL